MATTPTRSNCPTTCRTVAITSSSSPTQGPARPSSWSRLRSMPRAERFAGQGSLFAPAYSLWERSDPLPSYTHLHELARAAKANGIEVVSTLPLYATYLDDPFDPSPYSPVSRLHWNEVYLDDAGLPPEPVPPIGDIIDWRALAERRRRQLVAAVGDLDEQTQNEITAFAAAHPDIGAYARFRAGRDAHGDLVVEQSHLLAQFLADRQLAAIHDDPGAAALALDLPIGSHPDGYETWADASMFAPGIGVGAPPDSFFADGQNWGFPPPLPAALHASGHRLWRHLIERVGRHADVLRIDHAMAVHRLWWVPEGMLIDTGCLRALPARRDPDGDRRIGSCGRCHDRRRGSRNGADRRVRCVRALGHARHVRGAVPSRRRPAAPHPQPNGGRNPHARHGTDRRTGGHRRHVGVPNTPRAGPRSRRSPTTGPTSSSRCSSDWRGATHTS